MAYGQLSTLALAFQNSFGTENITSFYHMQVEESGIALSQPPLIDPSLVGRFDEGDSYEGANMVEGNIAISAKSIPLGVLLKAAIGSPTTSLVAGSVYKHVFTPAQSDFDDVCAKRPFTVKKYYNDNGSASLYYDLNASALEISLANGEFVKASIEVVGGSYKQSVEVSPSYPTGKRFTWDQSSVQIGGTVNCELLDFTLSYDDSLEAIHLLKDSRFPSLIKRSGERTIGVAMTTKYNNQTEFQKALAQTEQAVKVNLRGSVQIQSGYYDTLLIEMAAVRYNEFKPPMVTGQLEVSAAASAKYFTNSATALTITLTNTQAAY